ncbi:ferredoxin [Yinghuangia sp. ASG 101]|uniref:ferredoxin n=1 Tax=Yinghuangia sp. ASG 101 TaxID=2896848 RepID=UPI001E60F551|nr:ferredoxin [Yinghuangia sp. ASG 101]UGQ11122.1 ferredoxin [Yinghuangia sp. ASG 101]
MRFTVDLDQCANHGQCSLAAPDLFALDDDGQLSYRAHASDEYTSAELGTADQDGAASAADMCPMRAIRLVG